jgi:ABC-type uncharacterized transport system substrate-binding protein
MLPARCSLLCCRGTAAKNNFTDRVSLCGRFSSSGHPCQGNGLALRELGYIEGQNITIEYRYAEGKQDRLPELVNELVRLKVDIVVVAGGIMGIRAAKNATKTIPIVMGGSGIHPVAGGLVESLARPGGNVTGITNLTRELGGKRLELLKEAVPAVVRIAVLHEPANPGSLRERRWKIWTDIAL